MSTTPYREGKGWAVRVRKAGINEYKSGFRTKDDARRWAMALELGVAWTDPLPDPLPAPGSAPAAAAAAAAPAALPPTPTPQSGQGPLNGLATDVTLAAALGQYARDVGGEQKGAAQLVARVNTYLTEASLASLRAIPVVSEIERVQIIASGGSPTAGRSDLFCIEELDPKDARALRPSLERERQRRLARRPNTQELRAELANRALASITPFDLQRVKTAMAKDHYASATIRQEFALLSALFTHANRVWCWSSLLNPLRQIDWPEGSTSRNRVLSADERGRLLVELARSRTTCLLPWLVFAIETTMRKSEILRDLLWSQINFEARTARLHDSKGGPRDVPLTQAALDALEELPRGQAWERVFPISAAALAKAWKRACERAGVENLHIHDLRHTGATIHARAFKGDIFLLRKVTGHKTIAQLARYVNYDMSDVLEAFDAADARAAAKAAGATPAQGSSPGALAAQIAELKAEAQIAALQASARIAELQAAAEIAQLKAAAEIAALRAALVAAAAPAPVTPARRQEPAAIALRSAQIARAPALVAPATPAPRAMPAPGRSTPGASVIAFAARREVAP